MGRCVFLYNLNADVKVWAADVINYYIENWLENRSGKLSQEDIRLPVRGNGFVIYTCVNMVNGSMIKQTMWLFKFVGKIDIIENYYFTLVVCVVLLRTVCVDNNSCISVLVRINWI